MRVSRDEKQKEDMFENFRERLQLVQQDFTSGFKTLGDKSKDSKTRRRPRFEESVPHFSAGLEILNRYEESWYLLHRRTKDCAQAGEKIDGDIVMLSAHWEKRRSALTQLLEQLRNLPSFITELDAITASIAHLEGDFEEMESRMVYLETLCCQCEQEAVKHQHLDQLEGYKKKKRKEVEALEVELNCEHAQKVAQMEQAMQQKLRARQKVYEEAFHQDMEQYRSTGLLVHRQPTGADPSVLDQMTITNMSDQEALDDFLNSTSEDTSTRTSLTSGPDLESCSSESLNVWQNPGSVPDLQRSGSALEPEEDLSSEESEEPLVLADQEDVHADMPLDLLGSESPKGSDDSDSGGDAPSA